MKPEEIQFILRMRDEATKILRRHGIGLQDAGKQAKKFSDEAKKAGDSMDRLAKAARQAGAALAGAFASSRVLKSTIGSFAEYEQGMVMIRKTTNMTEREMARFAEEFDRMMMSMSGVDVKPMLDIAAAAGQLGITGVENIKDLTRIVGELGVTTDVVGEEGAKRIARLLTITREGIQNADRFTNVLVHLGNTTAATEREILKMAARIGQASAQFKLTSTAILGMSAAAAQLDFRPELFGTGMGRLFKELNDAALNASEGMYRLTKATGVTREEFLKMLETRPENAMLVFLQVLKEMRENGQSLTTFLESFNIRGVEMLSILGAAASNLDLFRQKLTEAYREQEQGTARSNEYKMAMEALWAQWQGLISSATILGKELGMAFGPILKTGIAVLRGTINFAIKAFQELHWTVQTAIATFVTLAPIVWAARAAFAALGTVFKILNITGPLAAIVAVFKKIISIAGVAFKALFAFTRLTAVFAAVRAAIAGVSLAMAGMLGWPALIVAGVVAAAGLIIANWDKVKAFFSMSWSDIGKSIWNSITSAFSSAIDFIKGLWSDFKEWLKKDETDKFIDEAAKQAAERAKLGKTGGYGIIGELQGLKIGKGLSSNAADALRELYYPEEMRRQLKVQKDSLKELLSLDVEARIHAGYLPEDIRKLQALIRKAEKELDPIKVEIENIEREIDGERRITKELQNQFEIMERIREIEEEHGKLTWDQSKAIRDRLRTLKEIEKTKAYDGMVRELRRALEDAQALTVERKVELEILRKIEDTEREIGALTRERKAEIEQIIAKTRQIELFRDLENRLDPISAAVRKFEEDVRTLNRALRDGSIDAARYNQLLEQLKYQTLEQRNPVAARVRDLRQELNLVGLVGKELEVERTVQEEINRLKERGVTITYDLERAVRQYAEAMAEVNAQSKAGIQHWMDSLGTFEDGLRRLEEDAISSLADALTDLFTGTGNSMRQWAANLGKAMVRLAIQHILKDIFSAVMPDPRQAAIQRANQALDRIEKLGTAGINAPQAIVNAGTVHVNGTPLGTGGVGNIPGLGGAANDNFSVPGLTSSVERAMAAPIESVVQTTSQLSAEMVEQAAKTWSAGVQSALQEATQLSVESVAKAAEVWSQGFIQSMSSATNQVMSITADQVQAAAKAWAGSVEDTFAATTEHLMSSTSQVFNKVVTEKLPLAIQKLEGLNWDGRMREATKGLIIHHTAGRGDAQHVIDVLNRRGFGAHYVLDRQGNIYQLAPDGARLAHMRPGQGIGEGLSNANTIGLEVIARNNKDLTPAQIQAAQDWIEHMRAKYPTIGNRVFGHGEVNPHKEADEGMAIVNTWRQSQSTQGIDQATQKLNELNQAGVNASQSLNQAKTATEQAAQAEKMSSQQSVISTQQEKAAKDQLSMSSQQSAMSTQQAGMQMQMAGTQAQTAAPQFQQAGMSIQQAGQQAAMAGQQAQMAAPGMGGLGAGITGLLGPLSQATSGLGGFGNAIMQLVQQLMMGMGGGFGGFGGMFGNMFGMMFHTGGVVGKTRNPTRRVPAIAYAGAPRFHSGFFRPDEYPAILQRGERVLTANDNKRTLRLITALTEEVEQSRIADTKRQSRDVRTFHGVSGERPISVVWNITTPDADSFRKTQNQLNASTSLALRRAARRYL